METKYQKDLQYYKFCAYGFLKNLRFFEPFLLLFLLEKGLTYLQIGTLYAIREIATNILEIPTGFIADALGRRRTMMASFAFYIFSFLLFFIAADFFWFTIAMLFYAIGEGFRTGTHKAMIFEYLKLKGWSDQKVYYYGNTRSWSQMGSAISSLIAAAIVIVSGELKYIFLLSIIPYLLDFLLIASYPKILEGTPNSSKNESIKAQFKKLFQEFWLTFKSKEMLIAVNNISMFSGFFKSIKDYLQPVLQTFALSTPIFLFLESEKRSALIIGIFYFLTFFLTSQASKNAGNFAAQFSNLSKPLNWTLWLGLFLGLISGLTYYGDFLIISILLFLALYLLENLRKPIGTGYLANKIDTKILASALSATSQIKTIWAAFAAILIGYLADRLGLGAAMMIISFVFLFGSLFFRIKQRS